MRYLKAILLIIVAGYFVWGLVWADAANDPNTLIQPPKPETEYVSRADSDTLWITTTHTVKRKDLLRQKMRLLKQRQAINEQIEIINTRLAVFN